VGAQAMPEGPPNNRVLCGTFNADGTLFVTGSSDKMAGLWDAYKWNDDLMGRPKYELDTLKGHENAVNNVQFSGCAASSRLWAGDMSKQEDHQSHFENSWSPHDSIITCLRDGSAINWVPPTSDGKVERWQKAYQLQIPSPPMSPHGPPQGNGPPHQVPLGVNMIVWSLDTCFILAAIVDHRICMWNAVDGSLMHSLTGHEKQTYILDVHPFTPRIAMGAGYDGHVIIWDVSCFTENPQNLFDLFGEQD
jgi:PH-interacting protein